MKHKLNGLKSFALGVAALVGLVFSPVRLTAGQTPGQQKSESQVGMSAKDKGMVAAFEARVKQYAKLRESIEDKMPKLSKESTPEQIQAHKTAFEAKVKAARAGAKPGQMFTKDIARYLRATIREEFKGAQRTELRETVSEADTKGVPLRINYVYPDSKELTEMPPTLLLKLPQLPKQVRYRFVNRNMLLVDRENGLIIDYMLNAVP